MPDFGTLTLDSVALHQVPRAKKRDKDAPELVLCDLPVDLNPNNKNYLTNRLKKALGSGHARPVRQEPDAASTVPASVREVLGDSSKLIPESRAMAHALRSSQTMLASEGLLLVAACHLDGGEAVLIAKVEHDQGMRAEPTTDGAGQISFSMTFIDDLIFGDKTRVFKIAVFAKADVTAQTMLGWVGDDQNGRGVADYFRADFLGCEFTERADHLTERFFKAATRQVARVSDPIERAAAEIALLAEMQSSKPSIDPNAFIRDHLPPALRDDFAAGLEAQGVPLRVTRKDTSLISSSISRVKIDTAGDATILIPPDLYGGDSFSMTKADDGQTKLTLVDRVTNVGGAGGARPKG